MIFSPRNTLILATDHYISENDLVAALKKKDRSAFEYLYDHYSGALYGVISRIIKHEEIAEEVLQDVFLKFWERFDSYDPGKGKIFTWMLNISRNQAIDKIRSREISREHKTTGIDNSVSSIERKNHSQQHTDEIGIKESLKYLTEEQRFIVEFLYFKGYTQSEIAEEFNIPLGTVKTRLRLAMQQLRMTLGVS